MKESEVIARTDNVRVRIMTLDPCEIADWHYHTLVTDDIFCLTGTIIVRAKEPAEEYKLISGQRCRIRTGRTHQLENVDSTESSYLLIQGTGKYDFNIIKNQ